MGFFGKLMNKALGALIGRKSFCSNPYLGLIIDANDDDVIADELVHVAMAYLQGNDMLPQDSKIAMQYFRKAAERGHPIAQLFMVMGMMRYPDDGNGEVLYWLEKAAEQGERQAMFNYAISLHRGDIGSQPDVQRSLEYFRRSAEKGYGAACARLALIYWNGEDGVEANKKIAKFWALETTAEGDEQDKSILSYVMTEDDVINNQLNVDKIITEASEEGEAHALYRKAYQYMNVDKEKVLEYWTKAAERGSLHAKCDLAVYTTNELKEYDKAIKLFEEAANAGIENAQTGLATIYAKGYGVEADMGKAWYWLEKAVNQALPMARFLLAQMTMNNELAEVLPDKVNRGTHYMELAAKDNYPAAIEFYKNNTEQANQ